MDVLIHLRGVLLQNLAELIRFYPAEHMMWQIPLMRDILDSKEFSVFSDEVHAKVAAAVYESPQALRQARWWHLMGLRARHVFAMFQHNLSVWMAGSTRTAVV